MWWFNEKDKLQHLLCGVVISQVIVLILSLFTSHIVLPFVVSLVISSALAYGKELLYDKVLGLGTYNIKDFIASEIGVGYGIIVSLIFLLL